MSGIGGFPFGGAPIGPPLLFEPDGSTINASSRAISGDGRYGFDDAGNPMQMGDLQQRVRLLIAYGVVEPELVTDSFEFEMRQQIRNALRPLTSTNPPEAIIKRIEISTVPGNSYRLVEFIDGTLVKIDVPA